jgi:DNA repair protein RadC
MKRSYMLKVLCVGESKLSMCVNTPAVALRYWNKVIKAQDWFDEHKEQMVVLLLSTRLSVQGYSLVAIGSLNETIAHPREIFREAVSFPAYAIVVIHNHPSGDPRPSEMDRSLTNRLVQAADILQIRVLDHLIVGRRRSRVLPKDVGAGRRITRQVRADQAICRRGYYSFKEHGAI